MKLTLNITPVPLAAAVPVMVPMIMMPPAESKSFMGRTASYEAAGLPFWMDAFPPGPVRLLVRVGCACAVREGGCGLTSEADDGRSIVYERPLNGGNADGGGWHRRNCRVGADLGLSLDEGEPAQGGEQDGGMHLGLFL